MPQSINDYCNTIDTDTIYWCMGDISVVSLAINWLHSCQMLNIPILFVALDTEMYEAIKDINPTVLVLKEDHHVFVYKFIIGQQIMNAGKNWFYTDVDCVTQTNYTHDVERLLEDNDIICQSVKQYEWLGKPLTTHNEYNCGTGLFGMRNTQTNIDICNISYLYDNGYRQDGTCQKFVNTTIKHRQDTRIALLSPYKYPTGHNFNQTADWSIFHITGKYAYEDWDNTKEFLGDTAKIASLKKLGLWHI